MRIVVPFARGAPGVISYGSAGHATGTHLTAEYFSSTAGIKLVHVPYNGDAPALIDLMAGQIASGFFTTIVMGQHIRAGIEAQGNKVSPGSPEDFERFITKEIIKCKQVIASAGIRIE